MDKRGGSWADQQALAVTRMTGCRKTVAAHVFVNALWRRWASEPADLDVVMDNEWLAAVLEYRLKGKATSSGERYTQRIGGHNLNLRAAPGTAGTEVAVVLKWVDCMVN
ncbi:IS1 family transposase [Shigella boydii]